jgi:hypothetical protein
MYLSPVHAKHTLSTWECPAGSVFAIGTRGKTSRYLPGNQYERKRLQCAVGTSNQIHEPSQPSQPSQPRCNSQSRMYPAGRSGWFSLYISRGLGARSGETKCQLFRLDSEIFNTDTSTASFITRVNVVWMNSICRIYFSTISFRSRSISCSVQYAVPARERMIRCRSL